MKWLHIDELKPGMIPNQTITDLKGLILIARGKELSESGIRRLRNFYLSRIQIVESPEELDLPLQPEPAPDSPVPPRDIPLIETPLAKKILSSVSILIQTLYEDYRVTGIKQNTSRIEQVVYSLLEKSVVQRILDTSVQGDTLYLHSLRTALLSIHLGLIQNYDWIYLEHLSTSALFHDCGMSYDFCEEDDDHPLLGFVKLRDCDDVDMIVALSCFQHHEWYNGTGFPLHFSKNQLTKIARLLAVTDSYDRMLMKKTSPRDAIVDIMALRGSRFDPAMADLMQKTVDWVQVSLY